jgi:cold-inducible RNA-binding protein
MQNNLYVSSLAWATTDDSLRAYFATIGEVNSASVIKDKMSGRSRGFGFVEMATEEAAAKAVDMLNEY